MKKKWKTWFLVIISLVILVQLSLFLYHKNIAVLDPKGWIALREKELLIITTVLMLLIVVPVLILAVFVAIKYNAKNKNQAKYEPEWDQNMVLETIWWGFPCVIVIGLSILTWKSCVELDPFKPLDSDKKPIQVQAIALQWKWLFIYPEQKIASLNFLQIPEKTPINFEITSDAPMNSLWIPQLGGQIYAMPGMSTKLHLIAEEPGQYRGSSANLSGIGFAAMTFVTKATTEAEFEEWVLKAQGSPLQLNVESYDKLALPSENNPVTLYQLTEDGLYDHVVMKYMMPMQRK